jgi:hypothetical protein
VVSLLPPSCLSTVYGPIQELGSLFLVCYFHHKKDRDASRSKSQAHTMDGIVLGQFSTSNAIYVYYPSNQRYYEPDSYRFDPYRLPSSIYPTIKYNGGLFVSLYRNNNPAISEPYHPGTQVLEVHPTSGCTHSSTVMNIPLNPTSSPHYPIMWDDGTTRSVSATNILSLIPKPAVTTSDSTHCLSPFFQPGSQNHI